MAPFIRRLLSVPDCSSCPLNDDVSPPVPPEGNPNADIAIVGEGPGNLEMQEGRPFCGPSGSMLNWLLAQAGIKRDDCWVTNAALRQPTVVYRFAGRRWTKSQTLEQSTLRSCRPRLLRELEHVRPRVVLAFGNYALWSLTGCTDKIQTRHGALHRLVDSTHDAIVIPVLHPAALLRDDRLIHAVIRVLRKARRIALEGPRDPGQLHVISPFNAEGPDAALARLRELVESVLAAGDVILDVETTMADARSAELTVLGFGSWQHRFGAAVSLVAWNRRTGCFERAWSTRHHEAVWRELTRLLSAPARKWYWNAAFDVTVLGRYFPSFVGPHHDGMHLHWLMQPELLHGLSFACQTYLDIGAWKTDFWTRQKRGEATDTELLEYNARDCLYTAMVIPHLEVEMEHVGNRHLVQYQMRVTELAQKAAARGVAIDAAAWTEFYWRYQAEEQAHLRTLRDAVRGHENEFTEAVHRQRCDAATKRRGDASRVKRKELTHAHFNPNSPHHARWFLYELLQLVPKRMTKGGKDGENQQPSHSYKGILEYQRHPTAGPLVSVFVKYLEAGYWMQTLESIRKHCDPASVAAGRPRLYFEWFTTGQRGTRWSAKPAAQNWTKEMRRILRAIEGREWIGADAQALEYRVAACLAGIKNLINLFNQKPFNENVEPWKKYDPAWDAHSLVAKEVFGDGYLNAALKVKSALRTMVKRVVYALFYGATPLKIFTTILEDRRVAPELRAFITLGRIETIYEGFNTRWPEWELWARNEMRLIRQRGYQEFPPFGRRRWWSGRHCDLEPTKVKNTPIQLAAGDVVNDIFLKIDHAITERGLDSVFTIHGHDALYLDTRREHAPAVVEIVNEHFDTWLEGPAGKVHIYGRAAIGETVADV